MKIEEFDEEIDKLERFYQKEKSITDEQRQIWYRELIKQEQNINKCKRCNGTGYITYKKTTKNGANDMLYEFGAICSCRVKTRYEGWKVTDERYRSNFSTPYAEEVGL